MHSTLLKSLFWKPFMFVALLAPLKVKIYDLQSRCLGKCTISIFSRMHSVLLQFFCLWWPFGLESRSDPRKVLNHSGARETSNLASPNHSMARETSNLASPNQSRARETSSQPFQGSGDVKFGGSQPIKFTTFKSRFFLQICFAISIRNRVGAAWLWLAWLPRVAFAM